MDDQTELTALRDSFRNVLQAECPPDRVLRHAEGEDLGEPLWKLIADLGWTALAAPEADGGLGLGVEALTMLYRELGRALAPAPLMAVLLATEIIARFGSPQQRDRWLGELVGGGRRVALMLPDATPVRLTRVADGIRISGVADQLIDARGAELALILCETSDGERARLLVDLPEDGLLMEPLKTFDSTRSLGRVTFADIVLPSDRLIPGAGVEDAIRRHGALALAADSAGGAELILDLTVDYLKTREQFGRPVGSFQALKHRCADHKMALVAADTLIEDALAAYGSGEAGSIEISAAKLSNCEAYAAVAQDAIQLHGGIGFTWEYVCHLFLKRAKLNQTLFGGPAWHLDHIAEKLAA